MIPWSAIARANAATAGSARCRATAATTIAARSPPASLGSAAAWPLADEALGGEALGSRIGRVEQSLDLGVDPVRLVDEKLPGAQAPCVVGEPQVGDDHGEELLVEEAAGQVEPPAALADQVQVDVVGGAVPVGRQPVARVAVRTDLDLDRRRAARRFAPPQHPPSHRVLTQATSEIVGKAGDQRVEHAGVVVHDHHMRNPWHRSGLARRGRGSRGGGNPAAAARGPLP